MRNFYGYVRRHPVKVFMLVIMPLITGGALHNILKQFGIRLPAGLSSFMGASGLGRSGFPSIGDFGGGGGGGGGGQGGIQSVMNIAKMFM